MFDWIPLRLGARKMAGDALPQVAMPSSARVPGRDYTIENAWRDHLAPVLRASGFKGSGRHFVRAVNGFAIAVSLQGSMGGGQFAINLGLQPLAIPAGTGKRGDDASLREIDCVFRTRLSSDQHDMWWAYDDSAESKICAVQAAATLFRDRGVALLDERIVFFNTVRPAQLDHATPVTCMTLALLREAQGNMEQARAFARLAREHATRGAAVSTCLGHLLD